MNFQGLSLALLLSLASGAVAAPPVEKYESAVITFAPGSDQLNTNEKAKLKKIVDGAKAKGNIAKVEVAVWSDKEHPAKGSLAKADEKLADKRIESVKGALNDDLGMLDRVEAYNMANNASWLGRYFHTDEAKLDAVFAKGTSGNLAREDFALFKKEGAPSKAVVILKVNQ